jgi:large subunit ribosomal protein L18e
MNETKSTNPELVKLIRFLKKQSRERDAKIWLDVAENLAKPRSRRVSVNLSRINRHTQRRDIVVVPGKILGTGSLNHSLTIAAFDLSEKAEGKLKAAKAKFLSIPELVEKNPTGAKVKIIR